jgi:hypothetical protein
VAQITRSFKKAERDEIRKVVTLNRIFLEPGKIAPVVDHWWIEKEGRTQWVQKLRRGRKETECVVLNVRRDEGRRCETNTKVDVKLRWNVCQRGRFVKNWGEKKVLCAGLYSWGEFKSEATNYIFHYQVHYT